MRGVPSIETGVAVLPQLAVNCFVIALATSCGTAPTAQLIRGPGQSANEAPTVNFLEPNENITVSKGERFLLRWTDTDRDDNAAISFSLVHTITNESILLVTGIDENDTIGPDSFTVDTSLLPTGTYNILGTIQDGTNDPVSSFAEVVGSAVQQRVLVTLVGPGEGPQTVPPVLTVIEPSFNLSVAQDDVLRVAVQPTGLVPDPTNPANQIPFDPDSNIRLFVLLDLDQDPNNDDPATYDPNDPDPSNQIIVLRDQIIAEGAFDTITFEIPIDLAIIPPRPNGEPYFIRTTADDGTNPRVHQYAVGTINVVQLAAGLVDLFDIGRVKSGTTFYGFNPGANLGSSIATARDFDADGVDDFVLVAQFGNPRNVGRVGEAYLIYGENRTRFGGSIPVNSVGEVVDGVIFEAPPVRPSIGNTILPGVARSDGITDVSAIGDLSGDGRPEIIFGLPHVHGAYDSMDYDPGDDDLTGTDNNVEIEIVLRQGLVTISESGDPPEPSSLLYSGVDDVTINSADPGTNFGSSAELTWRDGGPNNREWTLIKFRNVLNEIPDTSADIDITTMQATLELRVFNSGGPGQIFRATSDFTEQTRYGTFAQNGGDPALNVDYVGEPPSGASIANVDGQTPGTVNVDVSDLVSSLVDGQLATSNNELQFIIVPDDTEGADQTGVRSSEFSIDADRPTLRIGYTRINRAGARGCYPDNLVNNETDNPQQDQWDIQWHAGGMAVVLNSQNRDNRGPINVDRLDSTAITLELVGQEPIVLDGSGLNARGGGIFARADNQASENLGNEPAEPGRISGARFMAGGFDFIDHRLLRQPPREGLFGQSVSWIGDLNNDGLNEIVISSPQNEKHLDDLFTTFGFQSTHWHSTRFQGSISVIPGANYNELGRRDFSSELATSTTPSLDQQRHIPFGSCTNPFTERHLDIPADTFEVFAEDVDDMLGGASSAGDFNQDGLDDLLCGAYLNNRGSILDTGAVYILYGRNILGDFDLKKADDPFARTPMIRIRGLHPGDQIGWQQTTGLDVNGDRIDDVFFSSPRADFGGVVRPTCGADFNGDARVDASDFSILTFNSCQNGFGDEVFTSDSCKAFDYDNDGDIDEEDRCVFCCLSDDCKPGSECVLGTGDSCCEHVVDNGFIGIVFGGVFIDGDRDLNQLATSQLPGTIFFGTAAGHRAGFDVSTAGDFNQDGFGDILISAPGEVRLDNAGRDRLGVVYLIFGGTHLTNTKWDLKDVGSEDLPGIVFISPYVKGRPNEAAPTTVAFIGDINADGFGDIALGNPMADFVDLSFPQGPDAPGSDPSTGRRRDVGDVYVIYGNNFGANRGSP